MLAVFFNYLSAFGYCAIVFGLIVVVLGTAGIAYRARSQDPARTEKVVRYLGLMALFSTACFIAVFFDWASGHGFVRRPNGTVRANISSSDAYVLFWGLAGGTVLYGTLLTTAWWMKRKRNRRALDEALDVAVVLREEYGPDEAQRVMERAGHWERWQRTLRDDL